MTWDEHVAAWSQPPVDDVGYISSMEMLRWDDDRLCAAITEMARVRYTGWRNHGGLWRDMLKIDETRGMDVLDFGCGVGMESLEFVRAGNRVSLADLSGPNVLLARRVVHTCGSDQDPGAVGTYIVTNEDPFITAPDASFDVIHCAGVLHHIPWATKIMRRFHDLLRPGGEVRLMLYSDIGWRIATGDLLAPHWTDNTQDLSGFRKFVRYFDAVGDYADWYSADKIKLKFGNWFNLEEFSYITEDYRYCAAVLTRKGSV
jgi:2-polyprenyl-3-methyl-5-hydroxy-6-metoxy-1,4-benzoquinol methylase